MNWAIFTGCPDDNKAKDVPDKGDIRSKNGENKGEVVVVFLSFQLRLFFTVIVRIKILFPC